MHKYKDYIICILLFIAGFILILANFSRNSFFILLFLTMIVLYFMNYKFTVYFIILSILFLFPQSARYPILPAIYNDTGIMLIIVFTVVIIFHKSIAKNVYNKYWLIFFLLILIQTLRGIYLGHDGEFIQTEVIKYLHYPLGFFFMKNLINKQNIGKFIRLNIYAFIIFGLIICLEMFYYYFFITLGDRVLTRQTNLLLISLMTSFSLLLFYKKLNLPTRFFLMAASILYILGIIIFMQRSLWLSTIISILLLSIIYIFKSGEKKKRIIIISLLLILITCISLFILNRYNLNRKILSRRTEVIENQDITELSLLIRILSYIEIAEKLQGKWLQGLAIGDEIRTTYLNRSIMNIVDNSFLVIVWKFGILGLLCFMIIFIIHFRQLIRLTRNSEEHEILVYIIVILTSLIGQMVNGLACVIMILYHYNFIWAMFIASTDTLYRIQYECE